MYPHKDEDIEYLKDILSVLFNMRKETTRYQDIPREFREYLLSRGFVRNKGDFIVLTRKGVKLIEKIILIAEYSKKVRQISSNNF